MCPPSRQLPHPQPLLPCSPFSLSTWPSRSSSGVPFPNRSSVLPTPNKQYWLEEGCGPGQPLEGGEASHWGLYLRLGNLQVLKTGLSQGSEDWAIPSSGWGQLAAKGCGRDFPHLAHLVPRGLHFYITLCDYSLAVTYTTLSLSHFICGWRTRRPVPGSRPQHARPLYPAPVGSCY